MKKQALSLSTRGFFGLLIDHINPKFGYKVYLPCNHSKKEICSYFKIGMKTLNCYIKELKDNNIVLFEKDTRYSVAIYLNPTYVKIIKVLNNNYYEIIKPNDEIYSRFDVSIEDTKTYCMGIYKLYDKDKNLIYIGKSKNIYGRLKSHKDNSEKIEWKNKIKYYKICIFNNESDMNIYEVYYIDKHKPKYNKDLICHTRTSVVLQEKVFSSLNHI